MNFASKSLNEWLPLRIIENILLFYAANKLLINLVYYVMNYKAYIIKLMMLYWKEALGEKVSTNESWITLELSDRQSEMIINYHHEVDFDLLKSGWKLHMCMSYVCLCDSDWW